MNMSIYNREYIERFQLRKAAGQYWLIDTKQAGMPYKQPLILNESGALIWCKAAEGTTPEEIAAALAEEYETEADEVLSDVKEVLRQVEAYAERQV